MGGESGPCRKSLRARREVQVGQEGDSSMTWSNRERMGDRVGERVTEQCKLKWDGMVPPTRIERATRGLGNRCSIQLSYGGVRDFSVPYTTASGVSSAEWA